VNDGTANIIGWTAEDVRKGGLLFGHRKTHPWDLLQVILLSAKALKVWKNLSDEDKLNSRFSYDIRIRHKDGKYRRIQQHAYTLSLSDDNKPGLLMMVSTDITAYKTGTKIQYVFGVTRGHRFDILLNGATRPYGSPLTERETEVIHHIAQGDTENTIAGTLGISVHTIKAHKKNILAKTHCKNTAEVIRMAMMEGWI
jgi:DNA-binding CsgD family transcriptional regulator